jgi:PAS domain S-box-containing protein
LKETQKERMSYNQFEAIFESLPDSVIVCDQEGKIIRFNTAALNLFEVTSSARWQGTSYQQFLQKYELSDRRQQPISLELWPVKLVINDEAASRSSEETLMLRMPSGREVYVNHWRLPFFDSEMHALGTISVFHNITHRYQKALHLQRVHEAVLSLTDAIAHLPSPIDLASPEETPLLSPPVSFVAQQLVDVIRQVLDSQRVSLIAYGSTGYQYYVAGSGLTPEQEQYWQKMNGRLLPTEFVDEIVLARLSTNQEAIVAGDSMHLPLQFRSEFGSENHLLVPLFVEQQWVGTLVIVKAGPNSEYTPEEIELVKAVAAQTVLIIEYLSRLHKQVETQTRALVQHEIDRLSNDFLTLASHELLTPLTAIFGNIQLAQRRLEALKYQAVEEPERVSRKIEQALQPLASASQSASLQERMINDMIDDASIQTNRLNLFMKHCDLLALLRETVAKQQRSVPEHRIVLNIPPMEQVVPIFADAKRITKVFNTYLTNALSHSPVEEPVIVQLVVADSVALVFVRDKGPGIPVEEQGFLWERFYRAKGSAVQHELDLSLGLGFYLCRAIIERHHGRVGVQSDPGHGETFWFTLPVVASPEK